MPPYDKGWLDELWEKLPSTQGSFSIKAQDSFSLEQHTPTQSNRMLGDPFSIESIMSALQAIEEEPYRSFTPHQPIMPAMIGADRLNPDIAEEDYESWVWRARTTTMEIPTLSIRPGIGRNIVSKQPERPKLKSLGLEMGQETITYESYVPAEQRFKRLDMEECPKFKRFRKLEMD